MVHPELLAYHQRRPTECGPSQNQAGCDRSPVGPTMDGDVQSAGQTSILWQLKAQSVIQM